MNNTFREPGVFFLWGYLKSQVYSHRPKNLAQLKSNIQASIDNIPDDMLVRVGRKLKN